jgi:cytochrome c-type biogenesis protein
MDNVSVFAAFAAGLISFLSPCVLPLVPGYISIISGVSLDQLKTQEKQSAFRGTVVLNSIMFIIGFSITFIVLGASATWIGQTVLSNMSWLYRIAGLIIIIFGLHLTGILKISFLYKDKRFHDVQKPRGALGALVLGLAFAFGWSPCLGPILAGILTMASTQQGVREGVFLLAIYSLGLGLPFLMTSFGLNRFLSFYSRFKNHFHTVEIVSGVLVICVGVLIMTDNISRMAGWFTFLNRFTLWAESFL